MPLAQRKATNPSSTRSEAASTPTAAPGLNAPPLHTSAVPSVMPPPLGAQGKTTVAAAVLGGKLTLSERTREASDSARQDTVSTPRGVSQRPVATRRSVWLTIRGKTIGCE